jgi:very-short-patch-repair endonuclease
VTRRQLLAAGLSHDAIRTRRERGSLVPVHRGVYRVGHAAPSVEATYLAAVLACGEGGVLGGAPAAHLHGLRRGPAPPAEVLTTTNRRVPGVHTRRTRSLIAPDKATLRGIPVISVPRTLVELARILDADDLARACHEARVRFRTTPDHIDAVLERIPNSRGAATLRRILRGDEPVILSKLERRFLVLVRDAGLPAPVTNRPAGSHWVDCRWPDQRLTVELDGYRFHSSRHAWEKDRERARAARDRGDEHRRYTWEDVTERGERTVTELRALLRER